MSRASALPPLAPPEGRVARSPALRRSTDREMPNCPVVPLTSIHQLLRPTQSCQPARPNVRFGRRFSHTGPHCHSKRAPRAAAARWAAAVLLVGLLVLLILPLHLLYEHIEVRLIRVDCHHTALRAQHSEHSTQSTALRAQHSLSAVLTL